MSAGAKPALETLTNDERKTPPASDPSPLTLKQRIIRKLTEIFEYNERLGVTRQ